MHSLNFMFIVLWWNLTLWKVVLRKATHDVWIWISFIFLSQEHVFIIQCMNSISIRCHKNHFIEQRQRHLQLYHMLRYIKLWRNYLEFMKSKVENNTWKFSFDIEIYPWYRSPISKTLVLGLPCIKGYSSSKYKIVSR